MLSPMLKFAARITRNRRQLTEIKTRRMAFGSRRRWSASGSSAHRTSRRVDPRFWLMMQVAMICGFATSFPMNRLLMAIGWKETMNPPTVPAVSPASASWSEPRCRRTSPASSHPCSTPTGCRWDRSLSPYGSRSPASSPYPVLGEIAAPGLLEFEPASSVKLSVAPLTLVWRLETHTFCAASIAICEGTVIPPAVRKSCVVVPSLASTVTAPDVPPLELSFSYLPATPCLPNQAQLRPSVRSRTSRRECCRRHPRARRSCRRSRR